MLVTTVFPHLFAVLQLTLFIVRSHLHRCHKKLYTLLLVIHNKCLVIMIRQKQLCVVILRKMTNVHMLFRPLSQFNNQIGISLGSTGEIDITLTDAYHLDCVRRPFYLINLSMLFIGYYTNGMGFIICYTS